MRTLVMAAPSSELSSTRRRELPSVWPKPVSTGSAMKVTWFASSGSCTRCSLFGISK